MGLELVGRGAGCVALAHAPNFSVYLKGLSHETDWAFDDINVYYFYYFSWKLHSLQNKTKFY